MAKGQVKQKQKEETLKKLDECFAIDATVEEACFYADISPALYYIWVKDNPALLERFNRLRNRPILKARQTVNQKMGESYANAMDYLKRKKKLEFGDSSEVTIRVPKPLDDMSDVKKLDVHKNNSLQENTDLIEES